MKLPHHIDLKLAQLFCSKTSTLSAAEALRPSSLHTDCILNTKQIEKEYQQYHNHSRTVFEKRIVHTM